MPSIKHSDYVKIVTNLGKESLKKALIKGAVKQLPFLASGPLNYLMIKLATKLAELAIEETEMRIFFQYIDFRTDIQAKDFEEAMMRNHTMQQIGTEDEKKKSEADLVLALNKLASLRK